MPCRRPWAAPGYWIDTRSNDRGGNGDCSTSPQTHSTVASARSAASRARGHRDLGDVDRGDGPAGRASQIASAPSPQPTSSARPGGEAGDVGDEPSVRTPAPHRAVALAVPRVPLGGPSLRAGRLLVVFVLGHGRTVDRVRRLRGADCWSLRSSRSRDSRSGRPGGRRRVSPRPRRRAGAVVLRADDERLGVGFGRRGRGQCRLATGRSRPRRPRSTTRPAGRRPCTPGRRLDSREPLHVAVTRTPLARGGRSRTGRGSSEAGTIGRGPVRIRYRRPPVMNRRLVTWSADPVATTPVARGRWRPKYRRARRWCAGGIGPPVVGPATTCGRDDSARQHHRGHGGPVIRTVSGPRAHANLTARRKRDGGCRCFSVRLRRRVAIPGLVSSSRVPMMIASHNSPLVRR